MVAAQVEGCSSDGWPSFASHRLVVDNDASETNTTGNHPPLLSSVFFLPGSEKWSAGENAREGEGDVRQKDGED